MNAKIIPFLIQLLFAPARAQSVSSDRIFRSSLVGIESRARPGFDALKDPCRRVPGLAAGFSLTVSGGGGQKLDLKLIPESCRVLKPEDADHPGFWPFVNRPCSN